MQRFLFFIEESSNKNNLSIKWVILIVFVIIVAFMFPHGISVESEYVVGIIWADSDLYAPFSFPIYKEEHEYQRERAIAMAKVYPVFEENFGIAKSSIDSLQKFFKQLSLILDNLNEDSSTIKPKKKLLVNFTVSEWNALHKLKTADSYNSKKYTFHTFEKLRRDVLLVVNGMYLQGIIDIGKNQFGKDNNIAVRRKMFEQVVPLNKYIDKYELGKVVEQTFVSGYNNDNDTVSIAIKIALSFLSPNIFYQKEQTEKELYFAADLVPRTVGTVQESELIIRKNERITPNLKLKLDSLRRANIERGADINRFITFLGKALHVFIIMWLFSMYLYLFRKNIFYNNLKILLIVLILLFETTLAYLTVQTTLELPLKFLIVIPLASMIFAIIFDSRVAFYGTVVIAFLVAGIRSNDYSLAVYSLVAGSMAVYTVRDIKKRTQIFRSIVFIFIGYSVSIIALSLERYDSLQTIISQITFATANAIVSPLLTYAMLILLERIFHITTDLTLVELADFNHPLLKELSHKAPGTFHHSISMGTLAEVAAEEIGANPILARVGAYYHDIGKIVNPSMFVENQLDMENKHQLITPKTSAEIIASHIRDGLVLGQKYNIPTIVLNFIPMHHGTTKIGYFYDQALEVANDIIEKDFRYPGPRPNSKETGIVMLADAIEASTRAIQDPTPQKIENNIDTIIKSRFMEGELDDTNLTLRDLTKIKNSFLKHLLGVHHARIQYPDVKKETELSHTDTIKTSVAKNKKRLPKKPSSHPRMKKSNEN